MRVPRAPFLAVLFGGAVLCLGIAGRTEPTVPRAEAAPPPLEPDPARGEADPPDVRPADRPLTGDRSPEPRPQAARPPDGASRPAPTARVDLAPMLFLFRRELGLTAEQIRHFGRVLDERAEAVARLQSEFLRRGVFVRPEYRERLEALQAVYYERMGRCLGPLQHRRFLELLAEGRFGDAVVFELPDGIPIRE